MFRPSCAKCPARVARDVRPSCANCPGQLRVRRNAPYPVVVHKRRPRFVFHRSAASQVGVESRRGMPVRMTIQFPEHPFTLPMARDLGISRKRVAAAVRQRVLQRLFHGVYLRADVELTDGGPRPRRRRWSSAHTLSCATVRRPGSGVWTAFATASSTSCLRWRRSRFHGHRAPHRAAGSRRRARPVTAGLDDRRGGSRHDTTPHGTRPRLPAQPTRRARRHRRPDASARPRERRPDAMPSALRRPPGRCAAAGAGRVGRSSSRVIR